jgi:hypothetical protein
LGKFSPIGNKIKIKIQSATHTQDYYEKKTPKSSDFAKKNSEIAIIRQKAPASHKKYNMFVKIIFLHSSLTYSHIWLIPLGDDHHHCGYIMNSGENKQTDTLHNNKQSFL